MHALPCHGWRTAHEGGPTQGLSTRRGVFWYSDARYVIGEPMPSAVMLLCVFLRYRRGTFCPFSCRCKENHLSLCASSVSPKTWLEVSRGGAGEDWTTDTLLVSITARSAIVGCKAPPSYVRLSFECTQCFQAKEGENISLTVTGKEGQIDVDTPSAKKYPRRLTNYFVYRIWELIADTLLTIPRFCYYRAARPWKYFDYISPKPPFFVVCISLVLEKSHS